MKLSIVVAVVAALTSSALADNKDKADALFKQGKKLMGEKRYADACEAFEKSYKLDPGIGAQLNIAKCYEDWGKIGRAFIAYQAAEKMAKDAKDNREAKIHELVVAIEPNIPHLTIKLPKDAPPDLKVTLDNRPVETLGEPFVLDPGPHLVEWSIKGSAKKSKVVPIDRGGDSEVTLDIPKVVEGGATGAGGGGDKGGGDTGGGDKGGGDKGGGDKGGGDKGTTTPPPPGRNMRLGGIVLGGAGVLAIGISSYMTLSARSKYKDALAMYCGGMTNNCDTMGLEITHDARSTANKATVVFFVGLAMVGGGVALYVLAPKGPAQAATEEQTSVYFTPTVGPDSAGFVVGGGF
jgi:uncharacterized membrane protein YgcG